MHFENYFFKQNIPIEFRQYMLNNELYENSFQDSLFKKIWNNQINGFTKNDNSFLVCVAYDKYPIGCAVYAYSNEKIPAISYNRKMYSNKVKTNSYNWYLQLCSRCGFYVKPEYRNKNVGSQLLQYSEPMILHIVQKQDWNHDDIPVLTGARRAVNLIEKSSNYFRGIDCYGDTFPRREQINKIIQNRILEVRYPDDPYPILKKLKHWKN